MSTVAFWVSVLDRHALRRLSRERRRGRVAEVVVAIFQTRRPAWRYDHVESAADVPAVVAGAAVFDCERCGSIGPEA